MSELDSPEELYRTLMAVRASGQPPPYVFIFESKEAVVSFLEQCSDEDYARFVQPDIHLVIDYEGEYFRFSGLDGRKPVFETPPETIH